MLILTATYCRGQVYFDELYLSPDRGEGLGAGSSLQVSDGYVHWNNGIPNGENWSIQNMFFTDFNGQLTESFDLPFSDTIRELNGNLLQLNDTSFIAMSFMQDLTEDVPGDMCLRMIRRSGEEVWKHQYGDTNQLDIPQRVIFTSDSGFAIIGQVTVVDSIDNDDGQVVLLRLDDQGNQLWEQRFGGALYDAGGDLIQSPDGGFLLLGWTRSYGSGQRDLYLIKTDSLGNQEWFETYGTGGDEIGKAVILLEDGNYLLTASGSQPSGSGSQGLLYKITPDGQLIWSEDYVHNGNTGNNFHRTLELPTSDLVTVGMTNPESNAGYLVKTDSEGGVIWERQYDKNQFTDLFYNLLRTNDGGFLLSGQAKNDTTNSQDAWVLKVDSVGCAYPNCTVGVNELEPKEVVVDVWPNPATSIINLEIEKPLQDKGELVCTNMNGQVVLAEAVTTKTIRLEVDEWPEGLYLFTLTGDDFQTSVRVVVQH